MTALHAVEAVLTITMPLPPGVGARNAGLLFLDAPKKTEQPGKGSSAPWCW